VTARAAEGPAIVDTDVFSEVLWNKQGAGLWNPLLAGRILAVSFATVGELWAGAEKARSKWSQARRDALTQALRRHVIIPGTHTVAERFGGMYARFKGQISDGDMWTAACALAQAERLPIATNNLKDFERLSSEFPLELLHPSL
jgi:predicted nucleic acid-binding protein